jgi:hypothetical protein
MPVRGPLMMTAANVRLTSSYFTNVRESNFSHAAHRNAVADAKYSVAYLQLIFHEMSR